ncbi:hypothetical protein PsorP6_018972 [Peronosclerospora sorghi]|nr:hypothetical protein PsorP6_018972 [Peronosclerospora sorghi]
MYLGHAVLMNRACGIPWDDLARDERQPVSELWTEVDPGKVKELSLEGCAVGEVEDFRGAPEAAVVPYPSVMPEVRSRYVDERQAAVAVKPPVGEKIREALGNLLGPALSELLMDEFEGVVRHFASHSSPYVPKLNNKDVGSLVDDLSPNLHLLLLN